MTIISFDEDAVDTRDLSKIDSVAEQASIESAIVALPAKYRELLLLKYDNGLTEKEIAGALSMTEANVHKTIQRAKKRLSQILDEQEADNR